MTGHLDALARRVEDDPFFLACSLRLYAKSERLDDPQLAQTLGCSGETLSLLRLCRAPIPEPGVFQKGIDQIATKYHVNSDVLAQAVRRGQAIIEVGRGSANRGILAAARDGKIQKKRKKQ